MPDRPGTACWCRRRESAAGVGALLGVVAGGSLAGRLPPALRIGTVIAAGAPLFGLLRLAPDLAVAVILLGLAAFAWGPYFAFERTLVQRLVPEEARPRCASWPASVSPTPCSW